jgi:hypothetical protein
MSRVPSPSLPDPTGFSSAPGVLSALGTFRDMSGIKELGPYLETLSNNATQLRAIPIDMFTQMYATSDIPAVRLREVTT